MQKNMFLKGASVRVGQSTLAQETEPEMSLKDFFNLPTTLVVIYVIIFGTCLLGLIGNSLTAVVLTRIKWKKSVIILFLGLVSCHSLELLHQLYANILTHSFFSDRFAMKLMSLAPISLTVQTFANTGATCFTILLSADRYLNLCRPLLARELCTTKVATYAVGGIIMLSTLLAIPTLYEHEVVRVRIFDEILASLNLTIDVLKLEAMDMPEELIYITRSPTSTLHYNCMIALHVVTQVILPWLVLAGLNILVYVQVRKLKKVGAGESLNDEQEHDLSLTRVVLTLVVVYFVSNLLVVYSYFEILLRNNADESLNQLSIVARFNEFFVVIAAGLNFWILIYLDSRFLSSFIRLWPRRLACCSGKMEDQSGLVVHMENSPGSTISFRTLTNEPC